MICIFSAHLVHQTSGSKNVTPNNLFDKSTGNKELSIATLMVEIQLVGLNSFEVEY